MVLRHAPLPQPPSVDLLILGAGWTSQFLIPLLQSSHITYAATTTTGHDDTIPFKFDPSSDSPEPYSALPSARTILITFPLHGTGPSKLLTSLYAQTHPPPSPPTSTPNAPNSDSDPSPSPYSFQYIQLGSTQIFTSPHWNTPSSPTSPTSSRALAEAELLSLGNSCILNLAGLYGGRRDPRHWVPLVAKTKEQVRAKKAVHLVHGVDVARAIVGVHERFGAVGSGKRWLVTDLRVYDWWDLIGSWGEEEEREGEEEGGGGRKGMKRVEKGEEGDGVVVKDEEEAGAERPEYAKWVGECMREEGVRALPRGPETLGRVLDSSEFWEAIGLWPTMGRVR